MSTNRVVCLGESQAIRRSDNATAWVLPGMLCTVGQDGLTPNANTPVERGLVLAVEDWDTGKGCDSWYREDNLVNYVTPFPGMEAWLLITENVNKGSYVTADQSVAGLPGCVSVTATLTEAIGQVMEVMNDYDATSGDPQRVRIRFI